MIDSQRVAQMAVVRFRWSLHVANGSVRGLSYSVLIGLLLAGVTPKCWAADTAEAIESSVEDSEKKRQQAHRLFRHGIELTERDEFRKSIQAFVAAYALVPHYAALYNIGRNLESLGELKAAKAAFERYLVEGGVELQAARVLEINQRLEQIAAAPSAEEGGLERSSQGETLVESRQALASAELVPRCDVPSALLFVDGIRKVAAPLDGAVRLEPGTWNAEFRTEQGELISAHRLGLRGATRTELWCVPRPRERTAVDSGSSSSLPGEAPDPELSAIPTLSYWLGAASLACAGTAGGLWVWNESRVARWDRQDAAMDEQARDPSVSDRQLAKRLVENNSLAQQIRNTELAWGTLGAGSLMLAAWSTYLVFSNEATPIMARVAPNGFSVLGRW